MNCIVHDLGILMKLAHTKSKFQFFVTHGDLFFCSCCLNSF